MLHDEEYFKRQKESILRLDGGPGSGNHHHKGVKGQRGGSAPGYGNKETNSGTVSIGNKVYTYESAKKEFVKPQKLDYDGMRKFPDQTIFEDVKTGTKFKYEKEFDDPEAGFNGLSIMRQGKWYAINLEGETWDIDKHDIDKIIDEGEFKALIIEPNVPVSVSSQYDEKRISEAKKKFEQQVYDELAPVTSKVWKNISQEQRTALIEYTGPLYSSINSYLRTGEGKHLKERVDLISSAIDKSEIPNDLVVSRICNKDVISEWLKRNPNDPDDVKKCIDTFVQEKGFCSTSAKSHVIDGVFPEGGDVIFEFFVPKGSKAIYAEPFSKHGNGEKEYYTGEIHKTSNVSYENELLLQKDSGFRITSVEYKIENQKLRYFIKGELINQGEN